MTTDPTPAPKPTTGMTIGDDRRFDEQFPLAPIDD